MKTYVVYNKGDNFIYDLTVNLSTVNSTMIQNVSVGVGITTDETIDMSPSMRYITNLSTFELVDAVSIMAQALYVRKKVENSYIYFLSAIWTPALTASGVIPASATVTVGNTNELQNILYLSELQMIDYGTYQVMSNEFLKFRTMIVDLGGLMSEVTWHDDV